MKKVILAAVLLSVTLMGTAHAASPYKVCQDVKKIAGLVMEARQRGMSQSAAYKIMDNAMFRSVVRDAYKRGQRTTAAGKTRVKEVFQKKWHNTCMDVYAAKGANI